VQPIPEAIHETDDGSEVVRAATVCTLGLEATTQLTWDDATDWQDWCSGIFAGHLGAHLRDCYVHTASNAIDQLVFRDRDLGARLSQSERGRLGAAGSQFLETLAGAKHVRGIERVRDAVLEGHCDGLFPTVFAMQAALFHVPLGQAIFVYAYLEWRAGNADRHLRDFMGSSHAKCVDLSSILQLEAPGASTRLVSV
jgi:hypothetical protein